MIDYSDDNLILFLFQVKGSVLPQAVKWAISSAIIAVALHMMWRLAFANDLDADGELIILKSADGVALIWSGYTSVLGLFVVFRNNQAYSRFWEGGTLLNQLRGEWFNAVSSLLSFCSNEKDKAEDVWLFQQLVVRLASLAHCSALHEICDIPQDQMEVLDAGSLEPAVIRCLEEAPDRVEVVVHWIQRLIVKARREGTVNIDPPILSRCFQELSRGVVNLNNVRKIKDIPFPFPYNQMLVFLLIVHWLATPMLASIVINTWYWAGVSCFFVTLGFWSVIYIAKEIDNPFGTDPNDLPMVEVQEEFNRSLLYLLEPLVQRPPRLSGIARDSQPHKMSWSDVLEIVENKERERMGESPDAFGTEDSKRSGRMSVSARNSRALLPKRLRHTVTRCSQSAIRRSVSASSQYSKKSDKDSEHPAADSRTEGEGQLVEKSMDLEQPIKEEKARELLPHVESAALESLSRLEQLLEQNQGVKQWGDGKYLLVQVISDVPPDLLPLAKQQVSTDPTAEGTATAATGQMTALRNSEIFPEQTNGLRDGASSSPEPSSVPFHEGTPYDGGHLESSVRV